MANSNIVVRAVLGETTIVLSFSNIKIARFVASQLTNQQFDVTIQLQKSIEI